MKRIVYDVTECVKVWYQRRIEVTEEDVRAFLARAMASAASSPYLAALEKERLLHYYQEELDNFASDAEHSVWEEAACEQYDELRAFLGEPIEEESVRTDLEALEVEGWDDEEKSQEANNIDDGQSSAE